MDLVPVFRILFERRVLVALGILAAVATGLLAGRVADARTSVAPAGVGIARVVLDTQRSQLVASAPTGADTLSLRATLLADTLASSAGTSAVARTAGIAPEDLAVLVPASTAKPRVDTPLVSRIIGVSTPVAPYIVEVATDGETPVISIRAYAADDGRVLQLTKAAVAALGSLLIAKDGTGSRGFVLDTAVAPRVEHAPVHSNRALIMAGAAIVTFVAWCLAIVLAVALWRRWRGLRRADRRDGLLGRAPIRTLLAILGLSLLIGVLSTIASVSRISGSPPHVERRNPQTAGVVMHVLVDLKRSGITDKSAQWAYFHRMSTRADVMAHLLATDTVIAYVGRRASIAPNHIAAVAPIGMSVSYALTEPGSEAEARNIALAHRPYRLEFQSGKDDPIVAIYAEAPTRDEAQRLALASIAGARDYFDDVSAKTPLPPVSSDDPVDPFANGDRTNAVTFTELGAARSVRLTASADMKVAIVTFPFAFGVALAGLLALASLRRRRHATPQRSVEPDVPAAHATPLGRPNLTAATVLRWSAPTLQPGGAVALGAARPVASRRPTHASEGDWPRTSRLLPWMLSGFMVVLWLVPFDSIKLAVPSPIDLWLDRVVLPIIVGVWALLLAIGGRSAPRLQLSRMHIAVGGFVVVAFLSAILSAGSLNHTLEFDGALKKLPLMLSYPMVFVMFASVIRRSEVAAFMKLTLVLAVLCALGMAWEDHVGRNMFFEWSDRLLPNVFHVNAAATGWDTEGRRLIHGPTAHPLVAAGMLSMAFPIAILGVIQDGSLRSKILYGFAGAALLIGVLSTQRKTGLVAPVAGLATLAYFRRQQLLRLAPLGVLGVVALLIVAPGVVVPVINQFSPSHLGGADTVSDRASDYDAIRPDVLSHVAFGRGYGSYDPGQHRVLDSQILGTMIEMGVIGLVAFLLMGITVVSTTRRAIHARDPRWAPSALACAAAAVVFILLAFLFDSTAFPQLPYVFMCFAGFAAVVAGNPQPAAPRHGDDYASALAAGR